MAGQLPHDGIALRLHEAQDSSSSPPLYRGWRKTLHASAVENRIICRIQFGFNVDVYPICPGMLRGGDLLSKGKLGGWCKGLVRKQKDIPLPMRSVWRPVALSFWPIVPPRGYKPGVF